MSEGQAAEELEACRRYTIKPGGEVPAAMPPPPRPENLSEVNQLPAWYKPQTGKGQTMEQIITTMADGEFYGLEFPFTLKMLQEPTFNAGFLTKAFHAAGTLPKDNKVKRIVKMKELPMSGYDAAGGAGMKGLVTVQYEKDDPKLHTELFVKVPFQSTDNMTWRMNMSMFGDPDGGEISAYQFLTYMLPFRTPKMYFVDISRKTTNYIIITEKIPFPPKGGELAPYHIHPASGKYQDFELKDPVKPYYALMRAMARMAAWDKQGRFEGVREVFESTTYARMGGREKVLTEKYYKKEAESQATPEQLKEYMKSTMQGIFAAGAKKTKQVQRWVDNTVRFVSEVAPWLFPADVKEKDFLGQLAAKMDFLNKASGCIGYWANNAEDFGERFFGLMHPNLQVDNAFFWVDEEGEYHAGLLDWGGCGYMNYSGVFLGAVAGAMPEVYLEHEERWFHTFAEEFTRFGGGDMDPCLLTKMSRLMYGGSVPSSLAKVGTDILELTTEEEWKTIKDRKDEKLMGRWNVRCSTFELESRLVVFRRGPHWQCVLDFCQEWGLPTDPF
uniref:Uncharacterized protein n=1 Tax=Alexandrium monilatum TaxID=311494 RepID=A0A7S4R679_9DINO